MLVVCLLLYLLAFIVLKSRENKEIKDFNDSTKALNNMWDDTGKDDNSEDRSMQKASRLLLLTKK